jgi:hypothetical protein
MPGGEMQLRGGFKTAPELRVAMVTERLAA